MLHTNGIPPKISGRECEEMICQQYWQEGKLVKELDVLFIKLHGRWHQLYFEDNTVFWRSQDESPVPYEQKEDDPFKYPLVNLATQYAVKGEVITDSVTESMVGGAKVSFLFEKGDKVVCSCVDSETRVQHIKAGK